MWSCFPASENTVERVLQGHFHCYINVRPRSEFLRCKAANNNYSQSEGVTMDRHFSRVKNPFLTFALTATLLLGFVAAAQAQVSVPSRIVIIGGASQSTTVNTDFPIPIQILVLDQFNSPFPTAVVTFSAPTGGASLSVPTVDVSAEGSAIVAFRATANTIAGTYTVQAVSGDAQASFQLTNKPDVPATITPAAGSGQSASVGAFFASPLVVTVNDQFGNSIPGATVTFTSVRTVNAAVVFPSGNTAVTDSSGQASISVRANYSGGNYTVTAAAGLAPAAPFSLTNVPRPTVVAPALMSGSANQLGVAWANPLSTAMNVTLTARGYDGLLITGS